MLISCIVDGKVLDWKFKKGMMAFVYNFYIGDIYVGQVFNMGGAWTAIGNTPHDLAPFAGFATRRHAAEFLLKAEGYTR